MKKIILGFAILSLIACNRSGGNKAILPVVEGEEEVEMTESAQGNEGHEQVIKPIEVSSEEIKKIVEKSKAEMPKAVEIKATK